MVIDEQNGFHVGLYATRLEQHAGLRIWFPEIAEKMPCLRKIHRMPNRSSRERGCTYSDRVPIWPMEGRNGHSR
jgi:hypothetical protein